MGDRCLIYMGGLYMLSWANAEKFCQDNFPDGHLASFHSWTQMNTYFAQYVTKKGQLILPVARNSWLGNRRGQRNADGTKFDWTRWTAGEPNLDGICVGIKAFICAKNLHTQLKGVWFGP